MEVSLGSHSDRRQSSSSCERTPVYRFPDAHMAANGRKKGALQGANRQMFSEPRTTLYIILYYKFKEEHCKALQPSRATSAVCRQPSGEKQKEIEEWSDDIRAGRPAGAR